MVNNQQKYFTAILLIGMAILVYIGGTNIGTAIFGQNIFGSIINLLGLPIVLLLAGILVFFALASLFLDVKNYPKFFMGAVLGFVALVLWISPIDAPGFIEEILTTIGSVWLTSDSLKSKQQQQIPIL